MISATSWIDLTMSVHMCVFETSFWNFAEIILSTTRWLFVRIADIWNYSDRTTITYSYHTKKIYFYTLWCYKKFTCEGYCGFDALEVNILLLFFFCIFRYLVLRMRLVVWCRCYSSARNWDNNITKNSLPRRLGSNLKQFATPINLQYE